MTLYLSGPITGVKDWKEAFEAERKRLVDAGYDVISPVYFGLDGKPWGECMRKCLTVLLQNPGCGVALIDGWENSKGCRLEVHVSEKIGIRTRSVDIWCLLAERKEESNVPVGDVKKL